MKISETVVTFQEKTTTLGEVFKQSIINYDQIRHKMDYGYSAQEALDFFSNFFYSNVIIEEKEVQFLELLLSNKCDYKQSMLKYAKGKSLQAIVDELSFKKNKKIVEIEKRNEILQKVDSKQRRENLKNSLNKMILEEYPSLNFFSVKEDIILSRFHCLHFQNQNLKKDGLIKLYKKYRLGKVKTVYGVLLRDLCALLDVNYSFCNQYFRGSIPVEEIFDMAIFANMDLTIQTRDRLISYRCSIKGEMKNKSFQYENIAGVTETDLPHIKEYVTKSQKVSKAFRILRLVFLMEQKWVEDYNEELDALAIKYGNGSEEFFVQFNALKKQAQDKILEKFNLDIAKYSTLKNSVLEDFRLVHSSQESYYRLTKSKRKVKEV